jgi:hypothetical protein
MKHPQLLNRLLVLLMLAAIAVVQISCDEDEPAKEDTPELITQVTLSFTPTSGATVIVKATDPDGIGPKDIIADAELNLKTNTTYSLSIQLVNGLLEVTEDGYDVTGEVKEEGAEHLFFFSWTGGFAEPSGDGNIDNRSDAVNYTDEDSEGLPIGLTTSWKTTTDVATAKKFRVILKHQPELKTATSTSTDGETDVDIEFVLNIAN